MLNLKSQIVYHDFNPDIVYPSGAPPINYNQDLDLDLDGINDFSIYGVRDQSLPWVYYYKITPYNGNSIVMHSNTINPDTLRFGDSISSSSIFGNGSSSVDITSVSFYGSTLGSWVGPWGNLKNHFIGVCFTNATGLKYGWIRIGNIMTIVDYGYNSVSNQSILAGEGMPVKLADNVELNDIGNTGTGSDVGVKFYKANDESLLSAYKIILVPKENIQTFTIDSAKLVLNVNSFLVPVMNKNIDTVLTSQSKDVYGNLIAPLKYYQAYVLSLPNLITNFDTLMSEASNELVLESPIFSADSVIIVSTKIPGSSYNLNLTFDTPLTENGILSYRLFFLPDNNYSAFNVDSANMVSPANYITITKTGTSQNLSFNSNVVKTYDGSSLVPFREYKAVLMSVTDTLLSYHSVLSLVSNLFIVYTQVPAVEKLYVTDILDNHNCSDLKIEFEKVTYETNISGYRVLIVPSSSLNSFSLNSANTASHFISISKTGLNQSLMIPSTATDVYGSALTETQTYGLYILTLSDGIYSDQNNLSVYKYLKYSTPNPFYAGIGFDNSLCWWHGNVNVSLSFDGVHTLDLDSDGVDDLKFVHSYISSPGGYYGFANVKPLSNTQICFSDVANGYVMANDSGDVMGINANWGTSVGTLRLDNVGPPLPPNPQVIQHTGMWNNLLARYLPIKLFNQGLEYFGWVKLSATNPYQMTIFSYCVQKHFVGINEYEKEHEINIWPNPTQQNVYFDKVIEKAEIVNVLGNVIDIKENVNLIDMSHFSNGAYYLRLHFDKNIFIRKVMVVSN